jgi:hypothetical protein
MFSAGVQIEPLFVDIAPRKRGTKRRCGERSSQQGWAMPEEEDIIFQARGFDNNPRK